MNRAKRTDLITIIVLCAIGLAIALSALLGGGAPSSDEDSNKAPARTFTYEDYNGKKIGIATGTNLEAESFKFFPDSEYPQAMSRMTGLSSCKMSWFALW